MWPASSLRYYGTLFSPGRFGKERRGQIELPDVASS